jgi:hypothetical protein
LSFNPTALTFTAPVTGSQAKNFTVNNTGNLAAPYTLTLTGTNFVLNPTSGTAVPGPGVSHQVTFSNPLIGGGARSGNVAIATGVVRCAPLPSNLTLQGN